MRLLPTRKTEIQMVEIELLSVDGCPHVDAARLLLKACVEQLHVRARIEGR